MRRVLATLLLRAQFSLHPNAMTDRVKLSEMSLEQLDAERRRLDATFFSPKAMLVNLVVVALAIAMALYAMQDGFSYILTAIIVALLYSVMRRFQRRRQLDSEVATRR